MKFYKCEHCGNLLTVINDGGVTPVCCGEPMVGLNPNTVDAAAEKHVPVIELNGNEVIVRVGSIPHPMEAEHFIEWIAIEFDNNIKIAKLSPGNDPAVKLTVADPKAKITAYAYCNLHGLWKS